MLGRYLQTDFEYVYLLMINDLQQLCRSTGVLTHPRHLIQPLTLPELSVCPTFNYKIDHCSLSLSFSMVISEFLVQLEMQSVQTLTRTATPYESYRYYSVPDENRSNPASNCSQFRSHTKVFCSHLKPFISSNRSFFQTVPYGLNSVYLIKGDNVTLYNNYIGPRSE